MLKKQKETKYMRRRIDTRTILKLMAVFLLFCFACVGTYIGVGVMLKADMPIVRNFVDPIVILPVSMTTGSVADMWVSMHGYVPTAYNTLVTEGETEEEFFVRMSDIDIRSLYQLSRDFPELVEEGWSNIYFDVFEERVSPALSEERSEQLREVLLSGDVVTKTGQSILALDAFRSYMLVSVTINQTQGYMAVTYDKSKLALSVTHRAHEGWWSTVVEHLTHNKGTVAAIPANDYTYNAHMGYGVVAGGFYDNNIPRYKKSDNISLYMGFKQDGTFAVGEGARYGMDNFTEGQGVLLFQGATPTHVIVSEKEQTQILEHLSSYIASSGVDVEAEGFDSIPLIQDFIVSFQDFAVQARYSWVIKENAVNNQVETVDKLDELLGKYTKNDEELTQLRKTDKELADFIRLVQMCDQLGAGNYAEEVVPVRSAYTAIGQREADGATFLFGIGGAKGSDARELPGNGATIEELQKLFLNYNVTNAAVTTSGNRVGFGWKTENLLHVQDTSDEGGRAYGAYIFK